MVPPVVPSLAADELLRALEASPVAEANLPVVEMAVAPAPCDRFQLQPEVPRSNEAAAAEDAHDPRLASALPERKTRTSLM